MATLSVVLAEDAATPLMLSPANTLTTFAAPLAPVALSPAAISGAAMTVTDTEATWQFAGLSCSQI